MKFHRYPQILITASVLAVTPLSLVAATDSPMASPQTTGTQAEGSNPSPDAAQQQSATQPSAAAKQRAHEGSTLTRNPEADRRDMEQRYPTVQKLDESPSDKSKQVGS